MCTCTYTHTFSVCEVSFSLSRWFPGAGSSAVWPHGTRRRQCVVPAASAPPPPACSGEPPPPWPGPPAPSSARQTQPPAPPVLQPAGATHRCSTCSRRVPVLLSPGSHAAAGNGFGIVQTRFAVAVVWIHDPATQGDSITYTSHMYMYSCRSTSFSASLMCCNSDDSLSRSCSTYTCNIQTIISGRKVIQFCNDAPLHAVFPLHMPTTAGTKIKHYYMLYPRSLTKQRIHSQCKTVVGSRIVYTGL